MTPDQLIALAREYAREECNKSTLPDKKQLHEDKLIEFYDVYGFLLRRRCLVEKSKVEAKYNAAKIGATEADSPECAYMMDMLEDLFPEIVKEVEG